MTDKQPEGVNENLKYEVLFTNRVLKIAKAFEGSKEEVEQLESNLRMAKARLERKDRGMNRCRQSVALLRGKVDEALAEDGRPELVDLVKTMRAQFDSDYAHIVFDSSNLEQPVCPIGEASPKWIEIFKAEDEASEKAKAEKDDDEDIPF